MKMRSTLGRFLVAYLWEFKLTLLGKALVACGFVAGFFIAPALEVLTLGLFMTLFFVGFFAMLVNIGYRTRIAMRPMLPDRVVAGETLRGTVSVRNAGRLPAYDVGAGFFNLPGALRNVTPETYAARLDANESATLPVTLRAVRRGSYRMPPLRAFSAFPLRLLRSGSSRHETGNLLVLPSFAQAEGIEVPIHPRYQPGGVALTTSVGESPEYVGNREFRPGDSIRRLDMRAWGRIGAPVVREFQEEYFLRLALVLDTYIPRLRLPRAAGYPQLEAAISLTATITDALSRGEYLIDIFAAGPELYAFRTGRATTHFDSVLEILACIDACRVNPFETVTPALADELGNIASVMFVFLDWDAARRDMVRIAEECGCRTRVFLVRDGASSLPLETASDVPVTVLTPAAVHAGGFGVL